MAFDWSNLRAACENEIAREMARPFAQAGDDWARKTDQVLPFAAGKINEMSNMELLELIARVAGREQ
jgi:hypothetical protein